MSLVDKENDRLRRCLDLGNDRFEPVLELAFHPRPGLQKTQVERAHRYALQGFGDVARHDPKSKPLDDGRLADSRLAGQDRVVLSPAGKDIDDLANLKIAADDRIDVSLASAVGEINRELVERGRLGPGRGRLSAGRVRSCSSADFAVFDRAGNDRGHFLDQPLGWDLGQLGRAGARSHREAAIVQ